ncbi:MAG: DUF3006 domain-containing protein [Oscillospiraceae bacterium]|nr:DUF3006 domain-containing protein [Oscillospiraceae bacterium]
MDYWVIDRLEGRFAVCEHGDNMENLPRDLLPERIREGDCLTREADGTFRVDDEETERRREQNFRQMKKIFGE